jgi:glutaminase
MTFLESIEKIYDKLKDGTGGKNADYIPELSKIDPNLYAISIYTIDGLQYNLGHYKKEIAIESCSKVFTLALALEKYGIVALKKKIGDETTHEKFNSIHAVDSIANHTINSFNNGGAMATTSLLFDDNERKFENKLIDNMSAFAGRKLHIDKKTYKSEIVHSHHNFTIANLLSSYNRFYADVPKTVDAYTKQCSTMVTTRDIAIMAATIANGGINPKNGKRIMSKKNVPYVMNHMIHHGLYNQSAHWMKEVGLPAKSGVGGMLMIVVPGLMGIGIVSPPLNKHGNSHKGFKTAKQIAKTLHNFT